MPMVKLCVLVVSKKLSEDTQDSYGQRLPYVSSVHGILQARVLEWGAIAFSIFLIVLQNWAFILLPPGQHFSKITEVRQ